MPSLWHAVAEAGEPVEDSTVDAAAREAAETALLRCMPLTRKYPLLAVVAWPSASIPLLQATVAAATAAHCGHALLTQAEALRDADTPIPLRTAASVRTAVAVIPWSSAALAAEAASDGTALHVDVWLDGQGRLRALVAASMMACGVEVAAAAVRWAEQGEVPARSAAAWAAGRSEGRAAAEPGRIHPLACGSGRAPWLSVGSPAPEGLGLPLSQDLRLADSDAAAAAVLFRGRSAAQGTAAAASADAAAAAVNDAAADDPAAADAAATAVGDAAAGPGPTLPSSDVLIGLVSEALDEAVGSLPVPMGADAAAAVASRVVISCPIPAQRLLASAPWRGPWDEAPVTATLEAMARAGSRHVAKLLLGPSSTAVPALPKLGGMLPHAVVWIGAAALAGVPEVVSAATPAAVIALHGLPDPAALDGRSWREAADADAERLRAASSSTVASFATAGPRAGDKGRMPQRGCGESAGRTMRTLPGGDLQRLLGVWTGEARNAGIGTDDGEL
ncbi:hypothetical protein FNF28_02797 [Cafeteria roenbergensis]|nr:hypothetical protein FNF28_02797 [Cafeteria roenbergensis]